MRKVLIARAGGYERLKIVEAPEVRPGPGELRIAVQAIGVNYADCIVRMGLYASAQEFVGWPITPGFEVAGVVDAVGEGVTRWAVGSPVVAVTRFGGYATSLCVPEHQVFAIPAGLSFAEIAGVPAVYMTAWYALHALAHARAGETVLVHSAAGGVGGALCQFARLAGCRTIGVVGGPHKVEAARAAGADVVIDKSSAPLWPGVEAAAPGGVDVACDANGPDTLRDSYRHLAPGGRLVAYGFHSMLPRTGGKPRLWRLAINYLRTPWFSPLALTNENRAVIGFNLSYLFHRADRLAEGMGATLGGLLSGGLRPPPVTTYALDDVAAAHRDLESGRTVGKLVLLT